MEIVLLLVVLGLAGLITHRLLFSPKVPAILNRWRTYLDNTSFSAKEFYSLIENEIIRRKLPDVSVSRVTFSEGGMLSHNREYLRVSRKEYIFDICAAPFGIDYFVSWWFGKKNSLLDKIPFVRGYRSTTTYYELDTQGMFEDSIKACVNAAIDQINNYKGVRTLPEIERTADKLTN